MKTVEDLRDPSRKSGFRHVNKHPDQGRKRRFATQFNGATSKGVPGCRYAGPWRLRPEEAAQDACDYLNGTARRTSEPNSPTRRTVHPLLAYTRRRADNNDFGARVPFVRPATEVVPKQRAYMEDPRVRPKLDALDSMGVLYEFKGPHVPRQELDGWFGQELAARAQKMKPHALVVTHHIGRGRVALYRKHGVYVYYWPVKWEE